MTTRGPNSIFSGEILPLAPDLKNPELDAFHRNLLDYLRRLTGKLARYIDSGGGGSTTGTTAVFSAYMSTEYIPGVGIEDALIPWDVTLRSDSIYTLSGDYFTITVSDDGFYVVEVDISPFKNVPYTVNVLVDGVVPVYGISREQSPSTSLTASFMVPLVLSAGAEISIEIISSPGNDVDVLADSTRLLISRIAEVS